MSTDGRQKILDRVRAALAPLPERAAYPQYDAAVVVTHTGDDHWARFVQRIKSVNGVALDTVPALAQHLRGRGFTRGYCDPALRAAVGGQLGAGITVEYDFDRARIDEYQFGITRAAGAIAESGTIVLNDATTSARLGALAPWVHVAVLRPEDLWPDIPAALERFGDDPNTIWITGPSKTADVEGILIEGVHGPGEQVALVV